MPKVRTGYAGLLWWIIRDDRVSDLRVMFGPEGWAPGNLSHFSYAGPFPTMKAALLAVQRKDAPAGVSLYGSNGWPRR